MWSESIMLPYNSNRMLIHSHQQDESSRFAAAHCMGGGSICKSACVLHVGIARKCLFKVRLYFSVMHASVCARISTVRQRRQHQGDLSRV